MKPKDPIKERKIMEVTLDIVHQKGLMGVKMSEVARKVNISPSNLYIYFKNKEDLLRSVFLDTAKQIFQSVNDNIPDDPIYKKKIFKLFNLLIQLKINKKRDFSFVQQFIQSPYCKDEELRQMDLIAKDGFEIFENGQKLMILKDDIDVFLIVAVIDGTTSKLVELHSKGKITLDKKTINQSFSLVWSAIRQ